MKMNLIVWPWLTSGASIQRSDNLCGTFLVVKRHCSTLTSYAGLLWGSVKGKPTTLIIHSCRHKLLLLHMYICTAIIIWYLHLMFYSWRIIRNRALGKVKLRRPESLHRLDELSYAYFNLFLWLYIPVSAAKRWSFNSYIMPTESRNDGITQHKRNMN